MSEGSGKKLLKNLFSQVVLSGSTFVTVIGLGFSLSPSEYGRFALGWAALLVALSVSRAAVPEVLVNQVGKIEVWFKGALRAALIVNLVTSLSLGIFIFSLTGDNDLSISLFFVSFFATLQDLCRYFLMRSGKSKALVFQESLSFLLLCLVPLLAFQGIVQTAFQAWAGLGFAFAVSSLFFARHMIGDLRTAFKPGWFKNYFKHGSAFVADAAIGAAFNLWLSALIYSNLKTADLGSYRFLVTYFGISSLLSNFAKSGFTSIVSNSSRPRRYLVLLGVTMAVAPMLQLLLIDGLPPTFSRAFPVLLQILPSCAPAMFARMFSSLSTLPVVLIRTSNIGSWALTASRAATLTPGFLLASISVEKFGVSGAFYVEIINYGLMSLVPLVVHRLINSRRG